MGRLAIDIGGTFTDLAYFDEDSGRLSAHKTLTTPGDLTDGVLEVIGLSELQPDSVSFFVHGGTTVINAITERKGVKTAFVATAGFRDVLEIARANRPDLYNLRYRKPKPFVPRALTFEVRERVDAAGREIAPLNREDLDEVAAACRAEGVEAIAIQFLHSYRAPEHEAEAASYLRQRLPDVAVTASHEITREWREYERANTAVLNAYVQPIVERYFERLEERLSAADIRCPYDAMQSNGGTASFTWAKAHPITLIESGPAAGMNGAALVSELCGVRDVIYLDVGGTTAKCALIEDSRPKVTTEYKIEWSPISPGYPVRIPVADIVEIGAGGGSIGWLDGGGALRVGPQSAGSDPGPACYGRGGELPTVTDAKLLTGVLDPHYFAGGRIELDVERARGAMLTLADRLGSGVEQAAVSMIRVVDANMLNALKLVSIQRGYDPRDFALIAAGGGGAMHAASLTRELGANEIVIPRYPGYFSAWGMLVTERRADFIRSALSRLDETTTDAVQSILAELKGEAEAYFGSEGLATERLRFSAQIDLRYVGQEHTVTVDIDIDTASSQTILRAFHAAHERAYSFHLEDTRAELVTYRISVTAMEAKPQLRRWEADAAPAIPKKSRRVNLGEEGDHEAQVYERASLPAHFGAEGPLIVEEPSASTVVLPGQRMWVDDYGFLRIAEG